MSKKKADRTPSLRADFFFLYVNCTMISIVFMKNTLFIIIYFITMGYSFTGWPELTVKDHKQKLFITIVNDYIDSEGWEKV